MRALVVALVGVWPGMPLTRPRVRHGRAVRRAPPHRDPLAVSAGGR